MNIFEKEIMRRVKELDCGAVYRESDNSISVTFDGNIIAEIRGDAAEKIGSLDKQESEIFLHIERLCRSIERCRTLISVQTKMSLRIQMNNSGRLWT